MTQAQRDHDMIEPFRRRSAGDVRRDAAEPVVPDFAPWSMKARRALDLAVAVPTLVVSAPLWCVVAVAIKATSPGPVLFRQKRVGQHGALFEVLKFRSMRIGTDDEVRNCDVQRQAYVDNDFKLDRSDPRITPVGRWIRKLSIDELPQLVNVLRREMSIVGIRPLLPDELDLRPEFDRLCYAQLKPGITGLWQVAGRSAVSNIDRWALDRSYVENWSLRRDVSIVLRTPLAIARTKMTH